MQTQFDSNAWQAHLNTLTMEELVKTMHEVEEMVRAIAMTSAIAITIGASPEVLEFLESVGYGASDQYEMCMHDYVMRANEYNGYTFEPSEPGEPSEPSNNPFEKWARDHWWNEDDDDNTPDDVGDVPF